MKTCQRCGGNLRVQDGDLICWQCGHSPPPESPPLPPGVKRKRGGPKKTLPPHLRGVLVHSLEAGDTLKATASRLTLAGFRVSAPTVKRIYTDLQDGIADNDDRPATAPRRSRALPRRRMPGSKSLDWPALTERLMRLEWRLVAAPKGTAADKARWLGIPLYAIHWAIYPDKRMGETPAGVEEFRAVWYRIIAERRRRKRR